MSNVRAYLAAGKWVVGMYRISRRSLRLLATSEPMKKEVNIRGSELADIGVRLRTTSRSRATAQAKGQA